MSYEYYKKQFFEINIIFSNNDTCYTQQIYLLAFQGLLFRLSSYCVSTYAQFLVEYVDGKVNKKIRI